MELLSKPTAKEKCLLEKFRSQAGTGVHQFCSFATKKECMQVNGTKTPCENLHFARIIQVSVKLSRLYLINIAKVFF